VFFHPLVCASFNDTNSTGWKLHWYGGTASTVNGIISVIGKELFHNPPFVEQLGNVAWVLYAWIEPFSNYIIKGVRGLRVMGGWLSPQNVLEKWFCLCHLILKIFALSLSLSLTQRRTHTISGNWSYGPWISRHGISLLGLQLHPPVFIFCTGKLEVVLMRNIEWPWDLPKQHTGYFSAQKAPYLLRYQVYVHFNRV